MLFLMQPGGCKRLHWNTARRRKLAQELLDQVQLERDVREDVSRLSPMECFQLNLAAALDSGASLMTIQEDFEGFSVADFDQLVPILKKLQQTTGLAILLNTNSLRALEKLADEVFVFRNGTIAKKLRGRRSLPAPFWIIWVVRRPLQRHPGHSGKHCLRYRVFRFGGVLAPLCCIGVRYYIWWTMT